jgi:hypothetical protein
VVRWLPAQSVRLFQPTAVLGEYAVERRDQRLASAGVDRKFAERLAAIDQIRPTQRSLRVGWLFVAGQTPAGERRAHRVFHPLVTVPVRIERALPLWVGTLADVDDLLPPVPGLFDLVILDEASSTRNVGIECEVHPDGPEAHIERHLALRRSGWDLAGAHRSRWGERPGELTVDLLHRLRSHV